MMRVQFITKRAHDGTRHYLVTLDGHLLGHVWRNRSRWTAANGRVTWHSLPSRKAAGRMLLDSKTFGGYVQFHEGAAGIVSVPRRNVEAL